MFKRGKVISDQNLYSSVVDNRVVDVIYVKEKEGEGHTGRNFHDYKHPYL